MDRLSPVRLAAATAAVAVLVVGAAASELRPDDAERVLGEVRSALAAGDAASLADCVEFISRGAQDEDGLRRAEELVARPEGRAFAAFFNGLSVRSVDQELRCPAMLSWPGPADAWRAIFEQRTVLTFNVDNPYDLEVRAFYFVERDGRWRLVWTSAAVPGCPWEYRFRTPEYAHHALFTALNARDFATLYELIDPACRPPGMAREAWTEVVQQRMRVNDRWEADRAAAREAARTTGGPAPRSKDDPPYVVIGNFGDKGKARFVDDAQTVARVSHLWDQADKLKGPVPYETFVKRGTRWYWQPKPEYTLWPRTGDQPASQPASRPATTQPASGPTSQPEEKAKSGK